MRIINKISKQKLSEPYFFNLIESFEEVHFENRNINECDILIGDINFPLIYDKGVIVDKERNAKWPSNCYGKIRHFTVKRKLLQINDIKNYFKHIIDVVFCNKDIIKVTKVTTPNETIFLAKELFHDIYVYEIEL